MAINLSTLLSGANVVTASSTYEASEATRTSGSEPLRLSAMQDFHRRAGGLAESLAGMRDTLLGLRDQMKTSKAASVASGVAVVDRIENTTTEVVQEATRTLLSSGGAIEAGMGGFSPQRPQWEGDSTSILKLRGRYSGDESDTLTFTVTAEATQRSRGELEVTNSAGEVVDTLNFNRRDNNLSLKNGLRLVIERAGRSQLGDSFQVEVDPGGGEVDPDAPFMGLPHERLLTNPKIRGGSFEVNGVEIQVRGRDTINTMITKINASGAGVHARYNSEDQTIELRSREAGAREITLGNDTSNFLAAMKLDEPEVVMGLDEVTRDVTTVETVDAVDLTPGNFFVNNVEIRVKATDSVQDVVDRINGSETGALARITRDGELKIYSRQKGATLTLAEGSSNFLDAVEIDAGVYRGKDSSGLSMGQVGEVVEGFEEMAETSGAFYSEVDGEEHASSELTKFRNQLDKVLTRAMEEADSDVQAAVKDIFVEDLGADFFTLDTGEEEGMTSALRRGSSGVMDFLLGEDDEDGMSGVLGELLYKLADQGEALGNLHGHKGIVINIKA